MNIMNIYIFVDAGFIKEGGGRGVLLRIPNFIIELCRKLTSDTSLL